MAQRFPSVAVVGATGNLGPSLVAALATAQPPFETITILTRHDAGPRAPPAYPSNVRVIAVDYNSPRSLAAALAGVSAVVSAIAPSGLVGPQLAILDAAVEAGVRFFVPSEFGVVSNDARLLRDFPFFATPKQSVQRRLAELKAAGKMDYALVFTGLFLEMGLNGSLIDLARREVELWDDGEMPIPLTTVASIGKAVVGVLNGRLNKESPEIRVRDIEISQRRLLELAKCVVGEDGWKVERLDTEKMAKEATEKFKDGTAKVHDVYAFLKRAVATGEYGMPWAADEDDSKALGLKPWHEEDVQRVIRDMVSSTAKSTL